MPINNFRKVQFLFVKDPVVKDPIVKGLVDGFKKSEEIVVKTVWGKMPSLPSGQAVLITKLELVVHR